MSEKNYTRHPLSSAMGDMEPDAFIALQDSVGNVGVIEPIVIFEGQVLDGWNRYQAATGLGMQAPEEQFAGDYAEACDYVWARHGTRRNWDKAQRALAQAELGRLRGKTAPGAASTVRADAAVADVSPRTMEQARVVAQRAVPEVKQKIMDGDLSLKAGERIARLPRPEQRKVIANPPAPTPAPAPVRATRWKPADNTPRPEVGASKAAMDEQREVNAALAEEVDRLTNLAAAHFAGADHAERAEWAGRFAQLQAELKTERAAHAALKAVHAELQRDRNELLQQCKMYRNQLTKRAA